VLWAQAQNHQWSKTVAAAMGAINTRADRAINKVVGDKSGAYLAREKI